MIVGDIADQLIRGVENLRDGVEETLFEPVIRLGVTGLSRAYHQVCGTLLVANEQAFAMCARKCSPQFLGLVNREHSFMLVFLERNFQVFQHGE